MQTANAILISRALQPGCRASFIEHPGKHPLPFTRQASLSAGFDAAGDHGRRPGLQAAMASDAMETGTSTSQDPSRFYCPHPGCKRSFAELWRLKVHYRAPPDIRGSGKERGHGTELAHCPKCNKALKQGKHHVGCSAGKTAGKASKRPRAPSDDLAHTNAAYASSPKQPAHSPASPAAGSAKGQQLKQEEVGSDLLMPQLKTEGHGSGLLLNGFTRQPSAPVAPGSLGSDSPHNALGPAFTAQRSQSAQVPLGNGMLQQPNSGLAQLQLQQQAGDLPAFMQPAASTSAPMDQTMAGMPAFMQQQQPSSMASFMQEQPASLPPYMQPQLHVLQQQMQQQQPTDGMPGFMQQSSNSQGYQQLQQHVSSPPGMQPFFKQELQQQQQQQQQPFFGQHGAGMPSTSQPSGGLYQQLQQQQHQHQQQQHQQQQQTNLGLASVFDDVDSMILMDEQPPSPPPLPPDFPSGMSHTLFNFSQFDASHRMPHQPAQSVPMPSALAPTMAPATGLWAPDTTFEHSSDGDLMQLLFGQCDQPPTMATIHLHHFMTDDEMDGADAGAGAAVAPPPPSPPAMGGPMLQQPHHATATTAAAAGSGAAGAGNGMPPLPPLSPGSIHSSGMSTGTAMNTFSFGAGPDAANTAAAASAGPAPVGLDGCIGTDDAEWPDLGHDFVDGMLSMPGVPTLSCGYGEAEDGAMGGGDQPLASPSGGLDAVTTQMGHIKVEAGAFSPSGPGHLPAPGMQQQGSWHCGDGVEAAKAGMDADPLHGLLFSTCE